MRIATPCAANSSVDRLLTIDRYTNCNETSDNTSTPPGNPIRRMRRISGTSGGSKERSTRSPARPRSNSAKGISPPRAWPQAVPMASPSQPSAGTGPNPATSDQDTPTLTTLTRIIVTRPVTMSPAPRRQPMPTASSIMKGNMGRMMLR